MKSTHPSEVRLQKLLRFAGKTKIEEEIGQPINKQIGLPIPSKFEDVTIRYEIDKGYTFSSGNDYSTSHYNYENGPCGPVPKMCLPGVVQRLLHLAYKQAYVRAEKLLLEQRAREHDLLVKDSLEQELEKL